LYIVSNDRQLNIPSAPNITYKKEWQGWGDFLGTGNVSNREKVFREYKEANSYAIALNLNSESEWRKLNTEGKLPADIPSNPSVTYRTLGWEGWPKFLGTNRLNTKEFYEQLWSYKDAKEHLRKLKINTQKKFIDYKKSTSFPREIPRNPNLVYTKFGQWKNWGDFLSSGRIQTQQREYKSYKEARKWATELKLNSESDWRVFKKKNKLPPDIPATPDKIYANSGWNGYGEFLGYESKKQMIRDKDFQFYRDLARKISHLHGLTSRSDWTKALKKGLIPKELALSAPDRAFSEWKGWSDFLGSDSFSGKQIHTQFLEYEELKRQCIAQNIKSSVDYRIYWKNNKPKGWPSTPQKTYNIKGKWQSWGDFLDTNNITNAKKRNNRLNFIEARDYVSKLQFNSRREYWEWWTLQKIPVVPKYANDSYNDDGWISWSDFLGYDKKK
jgi:hypothetical protein